MAASVHQTRAGGFARRITRAESNRSDPVARAVGSALAANPILIAIPCHRVVRGDGSIGGYGGEAWRKRWLLAHEKKRFNDSTL